MPLNCSDCALTNQPPGLVQFCPQARKTVFRPAHVNPKLGTKQVALLHLINQLAIDAYSPKAREVRATWLEKKYSTVTGAALTPRLVKVSEEKARDEVRQMVGMLLAQRSHFLPVWAQLGCERQLEIAEAVAQLLKGSAAAEALPTPLQLELFRGSVHLRMEAAKMQLEKRTEWMKVRVDQLAGELGTVEHRQRSALREVERLDKDIQQIEANRRVLRRKRYDLDQYQAQQRAELGALVDDQGAPLTGFMLDSVLDLNSESAEQRWQLQQHLQGYANTRVLHAEYVQHVRAALAESNRLQQSRDDIMKAVGRAKGFYDAFERAVFDYELLKAEQSNVGDFARDTRESRLEAQKSYQEDALRADYGLQAANYVDPQDYAHLRGVLEASGVARQLYLSMHPMLKYTDDAVLRCKMHKLLASPEVQQVFVTLDERNLIHPGPHARLGVFVINALVPGSYDDRHREMVQSELGGLQQAMVEHGMDPTVQCHSCGSNAPSGRSPQDAASMWIRDHNPPTALYELGQAVYTKLGIKDYAGNGKKNGQILLPQCRECSKRQGALTSKVLKLIEQVPGHKMADPNFDLPAYLAQMFADNDPQQGKAEWEDFERVALRPGIGWRLPVDHSSSIQDLSSLITTGGAGSFVGINEQFLSSLGAEFGCHTCTDLDRQRDPFRNILWIADHQPPTSLVARGLMELPQIVYPHCWKCSDEQARLTRELGALFDGCFTKDFKEAFSQHIRDAAWANLRS